MDRSSRNIILLTIDCLRYDYITPEYTPYLYQLSQEGMLYTNCWSEYGHTANSFKTLWDQHFMEELIKKDYYTIGITYNGWLSKIHGYDKGFHIWHDMTEKEKYNFQDDSQELNEIFFTTPLKEPFFLWIHYMDCHTPYYPEKWTSAMQLVDSGVPLLKITPKLIEKIKAKYTFAVRYVDYNIGKLLQYLKDRDLFNEALIIVSADHGEEFYEHGKFGHDANRSGQEILHIPLIVKGNGKGINKHLMFFKDISTIILNS